MKNIYLIGVFFLSFMQVSIAQVAENTEDISPLLIGEKIPAINVTKANNESVALHDVLKEKPTVMLFYRGGWCPYCNKHLSAVGEIEKEINALGYQVIAFSPDSPEKLNVSAEKEKLGYQLFSDSKSELIKGMGIAFKAPERYGNMLSKFSNGDNSDVLPVPSVFITDKKGTILFEYISPNYKKRISSNLLLAVLKQLKEDV